MKLKTQRLSRNLGERQQYYSKFSFIAVTLLILFNALTFVIPKLLPWVDDLEFTIESLLFFPIIWGLWVYLSSKFLLKKIPIFLREPVIRVIFYSPFIYWDLMFDKTTVNEAPIYLAYLINQGLLPFTDYLLNISSLIPFGDPFNFYLMVTLGTTLILALILRLAQYFVNRFHPTFYEK